VLSAAAVMGKIWTRGRQGLYLKGKGVMLVRGFILNLPFNRIEDSFQVH
jgi:hypothetical protein